MQDTQLFPVIHPFYPWRNRGKYLVWDGLQLVRKFADGEFFTEDDDRVSFACVDIGDVDHAGIHADIADDRAALAVDHDFAAAIAEMTVQAVGITDRDNRDAGIALYIAHPAITDGIACRNVLYLQDSRL